MASGTQLGVVGEFVGGGVVNVKVCDMGLGVHLSLVKVVGLVARLKLP